MIVGNNDGCTIAPESWLVDFPNPNERTIERPAIHSYDVLYSILRVEKYSPHFLLVEVSHLDDKKSCRIRRAFDLLGWCWSQQARERINEGKHFSRWPITFESGGDVCSCYHKLA
jgi:hypothetical protein